MGICTCRGVWTSCIACRCSSRRCGTSWSSGGGYTGRDCCTTTGSLLPSTSRVSGGFTAAERHGCGAAFNRCKFEFDGVAA